MLNKSNRNNAIYLSTINSRKFVSIFAISLLVTTLPHSVFADIEMPKEQQVGDIAYMTGGIAEEAEMMRAIATEFPLEIVVVQKSKEREEFLADVDLQLLDAKRQLLLDTMTEGPYLYVKLPAGQYWIITTFNNTVKKKKVVVQANKHQKVVFWWPVVEPLQPEDALENTLQDDIEDTSEVPN